jgi:hypothetical protein
MISIQELGAIGETLGGIAVVATLFYLSVQVKHVRSETRRMSLIESNRVYNDIFIGAMNSPDLARVIMKAASDYESLQVDEQFMLTQYLGATINATEISCDAIAQDGFKSEEVGSADALLSYFFSSPGTLEHWNAYESNYTPPFRQTVNEYLTAKRVST